MNLFTASEIVDFAERIHENGANFLRYAIPLVQNQSAKERFAKLAEEELKYQKTPEKIFDCIIDKEPIPDETYVSGHREDMAINPCKEAL